MYTPGYYPPTSGRQNKNQRPKRKLKLLPVLVLSALVIGVVILLVVVLTNNSSADRTTPAVHQTTQNSVHEVNNYRNTFLPNIYVDNICVSGMTPDEAIQTIENAVLERENERENWNVSLTYQGHNFITITYETLGIQKTNTNQVYELLADAYTFGHHEDEMQNQNDYDFLKENPYMLYTTQSSMNTTLLDQYLSEISAHYAKDPVDAKLAYFNPQNWDDPFVVHKEVYGSYLDTSVVRKQIIEMASSGQSGNIELQPQYFAPKVTEADIRKTITKISEAITPIDKSSTTARTDNIRVALSRYNGKEVLPGKTISFNDVVGKRSMDNGFQMAIEYANGLSVPGWGGGVCQASTTIYKAALCANLDIVDRTSHSDTVTYTEFGQDATVYYASGRKIDFSFRNNTNSKIYILARVEETSRNKYQCVVRIYGQSLGENVQYKLRTETVETLIAPLMPEYQEDKNHEYVTYEDEEPHLIRKARDGFVNKTYLQRWENGELISEELISTDTCKARAALYVTGTKKR